MVIVSAYTVNTPYEKEIEIFKKSIDLLEIKNYKIYPLVNSGSWEKNCQQKAVTILRAMEELNDSILWIDADAEIKEYPAYFDDLGCDLSCYYFKSSWNPRELLSGTIYFGNTAKAKEVLWSWIKLNQTNGVWDQKNLQTVVDNRIDLDIKTFGVQYIVIDGLGNYQDQSKVSIIHHQASRRVKKEINGGK